MRAAILEGLLTRYRGPLRAVGDVVRGYIAAASLRTVVEGYLAQQRLDVYPLDQLFVTLDLLGADLAQPGALGLGARLACSTYELVQLRHRAQDRRAESCGVELGGNGAEA
jgi:hypothetical protein